MKIQDDIIYDMRKNDYKKLKIDEIIDRWHITYDHDEVIEHLVEEKIATKKVINFAIKKNQYAQQHGKWPNNPTEYVELWIKNNVRKWALNEIVTLNDGSVVTFNVIMEKMTIDAFNDGFTFPDKMIDRNISEYHRILRKTILEGIRKTLEYRAVPEKILDDKWRIIQKTLFPNIEVNTESFPNIRAHDIVRYCIESFIWQVKRKIWDKRVDWHLMISMKGNQGIGKSRFVERLIEILSEFSAKTTLTEIVDNRNLSLFKHFILFTDEMAGADTKNVEVLKNIITESVITRRVMGTNRDVKGQNDATFIGTNNKSIWDMIRDTTGNRRFFELDYTGGPTTFKFVNDIDFLELWKSVDENNDKNPNQKIWDILSFEQASFTRKHTIVEWYNDYFFNSTSIPAHIHKSETAWLDTEKDFYIANNGDLDELKRGVDTIVEWSLKL
jgi:hypothetical protein